MAHRLQYRRDTKANWLKYNPVLMEGEVGYETDTHHQKVGDGVSTYSELEYEVGVGNITQETGDSESLVMSQKAVTKELTELGTEVGAKTKEIIYTNDDAIGMVWDGSKFVSSSYRTIIVPLKKNVKYLFPGGFNGGITCSEQPIIGGNGGITSKINGGTTFIANENQKYAACYFNSTSFQYKVTEYSHGLKMEIGKIKEDLQTSLNKSTEAIDYAKESTEKLNEEIVRVESIVGKNGINETYGTEDGYNFVWDGSKFATTTGYKSYVFPLIQGAKYTIEALTTGSIFSSHITKNDPRIDNTGGVVENFTNGTTITKNQNFLVVAGRLSGVAIYTGVTISYESFGLYAELYEVKKETEGIREDLGDKSDVIDLNEGEGKKIVWTGASFVSTSGFETFVVPAIIGRKYSYEADVPGSIFSIKFTSIDPRIDNTGGVVSDILLEDGYFYPKNGDNFIVVTGRLGTPKFTHGTITVHENKLFERVSDIEQKIEKPLLGKNIVFFGDSIIEGVNVISSQKILTQCFQEVSMSNCVRGGIGGTQLGARADVSADPSSSTQAYANLDIPNLIYAWAKNEWSTVDSAVTYLKNNTSDDNSRIINDLKDMPIENTDIVVIAGGTNDLNASTFGSHDSDTQNTLRGGLKYAIKVLLEIKPTLSVYVFNPLPRITATLQNPDVPVYSDDYRKNEECSFLNLVNAVKEESMANHIPCGDTYHYIGINEHNIKSFGGGSNGNDYTHLTKCYPKYARFMYSFICANANWE